MDSLPSFWFECAFISYDSSLLAFEKYAGHVKCFASCWEWMTKVFVDVDKMWSFVWKQWQMIHSLVRIDFCIAECVNSFENVVSVLNNAC